MKKTILFLLILMGCMEAPELNLTEFYKFQSIPDLKKIYSSSMLYSDLEIIGIGYKDKFFEVDGIFNEQGSLPYDIAPAYSEYTSYLKKHTTGQSIVVIVDTSALVGHRWYGNMPDNLTMEEEEAWYENARQNEKPAEAYPVYILNNSSQEVVITADILSLEIIQEAKDEYGIWKPIEYKGHSFCGLSYTDFLLKPEYYIVGKAYKYSGDFQTELRLKLRVGNSIIYSDPFKGSVNRAQFIPPEYVTSREFLAEF